MTLTTGQPDYPNLWRAKRHGYELKPIRHGAGTGYVTVGFNREGLTDEQVADRMNEIVSVLKPQGGFTYTIASLKFYICGKMAKMEK